MPITGIGRSVAAVLIGIIVALAIIVAGDTLATMFFPLPPDVDPNDRAALARAIGAMPMGVFIIVALGWVIAAFAGPWVAVRIARRQPMPHAAVVGLILFTATISNLAMVPHPPWMWAVGILAFPLGVWLVAGRQHA
jgi:hypothetical protein